MIRTLPLIQALFVTLALSLPSQAQDAAAGEKEFKKCIACHKVGDGAKNGVGPELNNLIGRTAGAVEGYKYGKDMVVAGEKGLIWTEALVNEYIADPKGFLKTYLDKSNASVKMTFSLKDEGARADVVAYLAALSAPAAEPATGTETAAEPEANAEPALSPDEVIAAQVFTDEFMNDPVHIEAGKEIWFAQCTHCHGYKAYPGKAPKLKPQKYTPEFVFKRVYKGFKKMPAWNEVFTVDEIRQIVAYVKASSFSP